MAADLEFFKRLYLFSLTSHGLITGFADFSFTERCYWYLQSILKPCLTPAPLSVEKPDFPDFLLLLFLSFFLLYVHFNSHLHAFHVSYPDRQSFLICTPSDLADYNVLGLYKQSGSYFVTLKYYLVEEILC